MEIVQQETLQTALYYLTLEYTISKNFYYEEKKQK